MSQDTSPPHDMAARHDPFYDELHASDDFAELRRRYRRFAIPATVGFLLWFLLYVVMSNWAHDFMSHKLFGNINVALVFGLLQFLTTFGIAFLYSRYSTARLDPLAAKLQDRYEAELAGRRSGPQTGEVD
jgi:uncharacterized membrane protein (DUF485 family)